MNKSKRWLTLKSPSIIYIPRLKPQTTFVSRLLSSSLEDYFSNMLRNSTLGKLWNLATMAQTWQKTIRPQILNAQPARKLGFEQPRIEPDNMVTDNQNKNVWEVLVDCEANNTLWSSLNKQRNINWKKFQFLLHKWRFLLLLGTI